jgi:hypothetical protein
MLCSSPSVCKKCGHHTHNKCWITELAVAGSSNKLSHMKLRASSDRLWTEDFTRSARTTWPWRHNSSWENQTSNFKVRKSRKYIWQFQTHDYIKAHTSRMLRCVSVCGKVFKMWRNSVSLFMTSTSFVVTTKRFIFWISTAASQLRCHGWLMIRDEKLKQTDSLF